MTSVDQVLHDFVLRMKKTEIEIDPSQPLYADGLGLDSLETAELSAVLEDEFGTDPFSREPMPQTVGDIQAFYADAADVQV